MARFWNQLDKADIAVPMVFTKYSDMSEMQHLHLQQPAPKETQPLHSDHDAVTKGPAAQEENTSGSVMRQDFKHWNVRPEAQLQAQERVPQPRGSF